MKQHRTKNQSDRDGQKIKLIVIHGDAGKTDAGTIEWISKGPKPVSYHYLVGRDGEIHQFVAEDLKAWHAGVSEWDGCTWNKSVNACSIGVSFANDGKEAYKPVQYTAGARLVAGIMARHGIPEKMVVGHADVSPNRKTDPWKHFDWTYFRTLIMREAE